MLYDKYGVFRGDIFDDDNFFEHYGTPRHSGRYPWGSGENPYQRYADFMGTYKKLSDARNKDGTKTYTQKQIAASMGMTTTELRKRISLAADQMHTYNVTEARKLVLEKGMSKSAAARRMGVNESTLREWLKESAHQRAGKTEKNVALLEQRVAEGKYIDVSSNACRLMGLSPTALSTALKALQDKGYQFYNIRVEQMGMPGKYTTTKVLCPPGTEWSEVQRNRFNIQMIADTYSDDGGDTIREVKHYVSVDPKRVAICYPSQGGDKKDGLIELRRGVPDLSLGNNRYAQVRILVDGDHYIKGMATYADDLPKGVDIRFNTSKTDGTPMFKRDGAKDSVLKPTKGEDRDNPFGANLKPFEKLTRAQRYYTDEDGNVHQSALNIVKEEGDVGEWHRALPSQFLSKQSPLLAKKQLKMAYDIASDEFSEIASYNNPVVKASMLNSFADQCEYDAVHLQAAALPRQNNKLILPLPNLRSNEIYAPGYREGEQLALVRFPHGSISEIPILTNVSPRRAKATWGDGLDAVGINAEAASRLSGADFDGDTCLVIPMSSANIRSKPQFKGLIGFDTKAAYPYYEGMHVMTHQEHGREMGEISNLITDMTIQGASDNEICRALRHSMVIVDAEKHKLNYKQSEIDNGIKELKERYQTGGASTFLSRSTNPIRLPERREKPYYKMTPEEQARWRNGEMVYYDTERTTRKGTVLRSRMTPEERAAWDTGDPAQRYAIKKAFWNDGRIKVSETIISEEYNKGAVRDPYKLVSRGPDGSTTKIETVYADYARAMKDLARQARKLAREQQPLDRDPEMARLYSDEVESLKRKVVLAESNQPYEREAQRVANRRLKALLESNPELYYDPEHLKREKGQIMSAARKAVGAKRLTIGASKDNPLTDREWEAIQKGAISKSLLSRIILNSDPQRIRELATPRTKTGMPAAKLARAKSMMQKGYTRSEICEMLDVSEGQLIYALGKENL